MSTRHFLTLLDFSKEELMQVIKRGSELRLMQHEGVIYQPFVGRTLGMIFEKSSTRTRISFETGMGQFGGHAIFLSPRLAVANRLKTRHVSSHAWSILS